MTEQTKSHLYEQVLDSIEHMIKDEDDLIAIMATVVCELHHTFEYYEWTGFYRVVAPGLLKIGPYQGTHGCLSISFSRGVCGAAARERKTQLVSDVHQFPGHIACSSTTQSEIVVPFFNKHGELVAVLDVDSNQPAAFDEIDQQYLEELLSKIGLKIT